jgi:putative glutamine amidotransferase
MRKQPIIGITAGYLKFDDTMEGVYVHHDYHRSIVAGGGVPIVIPTTNPEIAKHQIVRWTLVSRHAFRCLS